MRPKTPCSVVAAVPTTLNQRLNDSVWLPVKFCPLGKAMMALIAPVGPVLVSNRSPVEPVPPGAVGMPAVE